MSNAFESITFYMKTKVKYEDYRYLHHDPSQEAWFEILKIADDQTPSMVFTYDQEHGYLLYLKNLVGQRKDREQRLISYQMIFKTQSQPMILLDFMYAFFFKKSELIKALDDREALFERYFSKNHETENQNSSIEALYQIRNEMISIFQDQFKTETFERNQMPDWLQLLDQQSKLDQSILQDGLKDFVKVANQMIEDQKADIVLFFQEKNEEYARETFKDLISKLPFHQLIAIFSKPLNKKNEKPHLLLLGHQKMKKENDTPLTVNNLKNLVYVLIACMLFISSIYGVLINQLSHKINSMEANMSKIEAKLAEFDNNLQQKLNNLQQDLKDKLLIDLKNEITNQIDSRSNSNLETMQTLKKEVKSVEDSINKFISKNELNDASKKKIQEKVAEEIKKIKINEINDVGLSIDELTKKIITENTQQINKKIDEHMKKEINSINLGEAKYNELLSELNLKINKYISKIDLKEKNGNKDKFNLNPLDEKIINRMTELAKDESLYTDDFKDKASAKIIEILKNATVSVSFPNTQKDNNNK